MVLWSFNGRVKARRMNIARDKIEGNIQPEGLHEAVKHPILPEINNVIIIILPQ